MNINPQGIHHFLLRTDELETFVSKDIVKHSGYFHEYLLTPFSSRDPLKVLLRLPRGLSLKTLFLKPVYFIMTKNERKFLY